MAEALIRGVLKASLAPPGQIIASRRTPKALARLHAELGVRTTTDNASLIRESDIVVLGVKPQMLLALIAEHAASFRPDQTVISIAAGVTVAAIEDALGLPIPVIRVMPNTPSLVGAGAAGFCLGTHAEATHGLQASQLLSATGLALEVQESLMNAVTAISGSGPAYVFYILEALYDGAAKVGLPPEVAHALVKQTVLGAAQLVYETGEDPGELRRRVTSPGGTTEAALNVMKAHGVSDAIVAAVQAARDRGAELGLPAINHDS